MTALQNDQQQSEPGGFCVAKIALEDGLRPHHGVLRSESFAVTSNAHDAAERILQSTRAEADSLLQNAQDEAQRVVQEAQQQTLQRADVLLKTLEAAQTALLDQAQDIVIDLTQGLFDRLVLDMTPRQRIEAALKRILQEAPPRLSAAMLRVHPEDAALLPAVAWEVKPDASIARGMCRLEASNGEWCADFSAAMSALSSAFASASREQTEL